MGIALMHPFHEIKINKENKYLNVHHSPDTTYSLEQRDGTPQLAGRQLHP